MMRRTLLLSLAAAALAATAVLRTTTCPAGDFDFIGTVVHQGDAEFRFPQADGWKLESSAGSGYTLMKQNRGAQSSFWGTYRVEEIERTAKDPPVQVDETAAGWTVFQDGAKFVFPRADWKGNFNPDGLYLETVGRRVVFRGTFRVESRP